MLENSSERHRTFMGRLFQRYSTSLAKRMAALVITALFSFSFVSAHGDSVVNSTGDGGLVYGGKYGCETDLLRGGVCTLRAAIEYANLNPDVDTITFSIPATAPSTINLGSA